MTGTRFSAYESQIYCAALIFQSMTLSVAAHAKWPKIDYNT